MRTFKFLFLVVVIIFPLATYAITKQEIITLSKLGISENEIIKAIKKEQTVFNLSLEDILQLKKAGVKEKVIKFMMKTPELFGKKKGKGKAVKKASKPKEKMSLEEKKAYEEKLKQEALKLAEEQKKAEEEKKKAFAKGQLARGMYYAEQGDWVKAVKIFLDFIKTGNFGPGTDEYYTAKYGIAYAFMKAGLYYSAGNYLLEVLMEGPKKKFFVSAFKDLKKVWETVNFAPPAIGELTRFYVGDKSNQFQDEYYYFLGKFFYDYSNFSMALKYLQQISQNSVFYGKAKYLIGLIQVQNSMYKSAIKSFQEAIIYTEKNNGPKEIIELSYLALARLAYETYNYDAAIYYYRKIPKDSRYLPIAFYESAWTYFMKQDYSRALGTFQALHSPYFSHYFFPELWILEATVYLNMCHYEYAKAALKMFKREVLSLKAPLKKFLSQVKMPADYYRIFIQIVNKTSKKYYLPRKLIYPVLSDIDFYNLYKTIKELEKEIKLVEANAGALGTFGKNLLQKLNTSRISKINEIGIKIQYILKNVLTEITNYEIKVTEIEVDLGAVEIQKLDEKTQELLEMQEKNAAKNQLISLQKRGASFEEITGFINKKPIFKHFTDKDIQDLEKVKIKKDVIAYIKNLKRGGKEELGTLAIIGSDSLRWPYEGEFWIDEIGSYRSFLREECKK